MEVLVDQVGIAHEEHVLDHGEGAAFTLEFALLDHRLARNGFGGGGRDDPQAGQGGQRQQDADVGGAHGAPLVLEESLADHGGSGGGVREMQDVVVHFTHPWSP